MKNGYGNLHLWIVVFHFMIQVLKLEINRLNSYWNILEKKGISGNQQLTDSTGHIVFSNLNEGMYLITQIGSVKNGNDTFESAPFLVSVPSNIDGYLMYDVKVEPKMTWLTNNVPPSVPEKPSEKNPSEDTNTGVQVKKTIWIVLVLCSFGMIVILGRRLKENSY